MCGRSQSALCAQIVQLCAGRGPIHYVATAVHSAAALVRQLTACCDGKLPRAQIGGRRSRLWQIGDRGTPRPVPNRTELIARRARGMWRTAGQSLIILVAHRYSRCPPAVSRRRTRLCPRSHRHAWPWRPVLGRVPPLRQWASRAGTGRRSRGRLKRLGGRAFRRPGS
jgi:hypothetical protein